MERLLKSDPVQAGKLVEISIMTPDHLASVYRLEKSVFTRPWSYRSLSHEVRDTAAGVGFVAQTRGGVVGYIVGRCVRPEAEVGTFAVDPRYRRDQIGGRLLTTFVKHLKSLNVETIFLEVRQSNLGAQNLYRKFGFQVSGVRKNYYTENKEDAVLMTLSLKGGE